MDFKELWQMHSNNSLNSDASSWIAALLYSLCVICHTGCSDGGSLPPNTLILTLDILNPRHVGEKNFIHRDGGVEHLQKQGRSTSDELVIDTCTRFVVLVIDASGKPVVPKFKVIEPRKNGARVVYVTEDAPLINVVRSTQPRLAIPRQPSDGKYLFLMSSLDEDTGWRYLECDAQKLVGSVEPHLMVPDLLLAQSLDSHPHAAELKDIINSGR
jgi:hypothetical protein